MKKMTVSLRAAIAMLALLVTMSAAYYHSAKGEPAQTNYLNAVIDRGTVELTITATGTINPVGLVNIGSQVSGTVAELRADFNDHVHKGQVLLRLSPTIFNAQVRQGEAALAGARASERLVQGVVDRNTHMQEQGYLAAPMLDQSRRELNVTSANVLIAQAQLDRAQADLDNSVIRSPIDGIIINRTIELGQTVAASFATPNLFQIARNQVDMQIDTNVSEADVAALKAGQKAYFSVDAYPDREFTARMRQFRLAPTVTQNMVTYNVVLDVDNKDEILKPGMTAQVRLVVAERHDVLRVPTAALRVRLDADAKASQANRAKHGTANYHVYRLDQANHPQRVQVEVGLSNTRYTEVIEGALHKHDRVVTRTVLATDQAHAQ